MKIYVLIKKITCLSLILISFFTLMSCDKKLSESKQLSEQENSFLFLDNDDKIEDEYPAPLAVEDFAVKDGYNCIRLEEIYEDLKIYEKAVNSQYANENHVYDVFVYKNFILSVFPNIGEGGVIFSINLTTSVYETSRGIKIGDDISDVFKRYGVADSITSEYYLYSYKGKFLTFYIDKDEIVTGIKLEII